MPKRTPETPLYVRLPNAAVEKLQRAAEALGMHKKDLVAGLVTKYVDPDTHGGLTALGTLNVHRGAPPGADKPVVGTYSFRAYDPPEPAAQPAPYAPPEIMNAQQAALFLQVDEKLVIQLAEAGKLPGKKLGPAWRFSRDALVAWLSTPDKR